MGSPLVLRAALLVALVGLCSAKASSVCFKIFNRVDCKGDPVFDNCLNDDRCYDGFVVGCKPSADLKSADLTFHSWAKGDCEKRSDNFQSCAQHSASTISQCTQKTVSDRQCMLVENVGYVRVTNACGVNF